MVQKSYPGDCGTKPGLGIGDPTSQHSGGFHPWLHVAITGGSLQFFLFPGLSIFKILKRFQHTTKVISHCSEVKFAGLKCVIEGGAV